MTSAKISDADYIAVLEARDAESRRTIRTLTSMLTSAMDRIDELEEQVPRRAPIAADPDRALPRLLDAGDVAELLGLSRQSALKAIKAMGGLHYGRNWVISSERLDNFISNGGHVDLS